MSDRISDGEGDDLLIKVPLLPVIPRAVVPPVPGTEEVHRKSAPWNIDASGLDALNIDIELLRHRLVPLLSSEGHKWMKGDPALETALEQLAILGLLSPDDCHLRYVGGGAFARVYLVLAGSRAFAIKALRRRVRLGEAEDDSLTLSTSDPEPLRESLLPLVLGDERSGEVREYHRKDLDYFERERQILNAVHEYLPNGALTREHAPYRILQCVNGHTLTSLRSFFNEDEATTAAVEIVRTVAERSA